MVGVDSFEKGGGVLDPLAHGLAAEGRAQPIEHDLLTIERNRVDVLGQEHVRDQPRADLAARDDPRRQLGDDRRAILGRAGVDRPDDPAPEELARLVVDLFGHFLADFDQGRAIRGELLLVGQVEDHRFDRQLLQPAGAPLGGGARPPRRLRRRLGRRRLRRQLGFDRRPGHLELLLVELLGGAAKIAFEQHL